jgi:hypothetical protein
VTAVERLAAWAAIAGVLLALAGMVYRAGQMAESLELLRTDFSGHEQQWMDWILHHADRND